MDLVGLAKDLVQSAAEMAVSYKLGQTMLRYADRVLWVVEKSARWAVPPALDQDDKPTPAPELIRPLPWVFFLGLLVILRATREGLSLINLLLGKPPLRSADIVMFIQSKRRYLRALKYQGNRNMRARENRPQGEQAQWLSNLNSLLAFTMCYRRPLDYSGNNNTNANDDQMLVVRKKKRCGKEKRLAPTSPTSDENTMERLIEKMVDMYGESSDDSEYTLTNATSIKSDSSDASDESSTGDVTLTAAEPTCGVPSSTPNKSSSPVDLPAAECSNIEEYSFLDSTLDSGTSVTEATENLINSERSAESERSFDSKTSPKKPKPTKLANGQTPKYSPPSKTDPSKRRDSEVPIVKITPADDVNITNGSTEGSYSENKQRSNRARDVKRDGETKIVGPGKVNSGKSPKLNKAKESKIRAPSWKKSKKL